MEKLVGVALVCAVCMVSSTPAFSKDYEVVSPDKALGLKVTVDGNIAFSVSHESKALIEPSTISMTLGDGMVLGDDQQVLRVSRRHVDEKIYPAVPAKNRVIPDQFNEMTLEFQGGFSLVCRAYNDGVAYRFVTGIDKEIKVATEQVSLNFAGDYSIYFPQEESFQTHSEREYKYLKLHE
ncbi:MAG: glycoside hydrolase family 97 N-terminal domain-containing protein, partial [Sedimentisphaerales bacterium]